jgi:hypothetical protein
MINMQNGGDCRPQAARRMRILNTHPPSSAEVKETVLSLRVLMAWIRETLTFLPFTQ